MSGPPINPWVVASYGDMTELRRKVFRLSKIGRLSKAPRLSKAGRQSKNLYISESPPMMKNNKN